MSAQIVFTVMKLRIQYTNARFLNLKIAAITKPLQLVTRKNGVT
jgi:hypothetical protein